MGRLTTHVLDTGAGAPAAGLAIELWVAADPGGDAARGVQWRELCRVTTNADGRADGALLEGDSFVPGRYELRFHAGAYLRGRGAALPDPAFLDVIPIRFGIADPDAHYHVPLLLSAYGYTTYRGS